MRRSLRLWATTLLLVWLGAGVAVSQAAGSPSERVELRSSPAGRGVGVQPTATASVLGYPWPGGSITYFNAARRWRDVIDRAARMWNWAQVGIRLRPVARLANADVRVREVPNRTMGRYVGFAQRGYAPGHVADLRIAHRICCDFALQAALHEWGHILGLDHRPGICAVMTSGGFRSCPPERPRPWLDRCRLLQRDDVRRASMLYGGRGRLRPLYCQVRPAFAGRYRLLRGESRLRISVGRWAQGAAIRVGPRCGVGSVQKLRGARVEIELAVRRGCARLWALYPGGNRSKAVDVEFQRRSTERAPPDELEPPPVGATEVVAVVPARPLDEGFESPLGGRWISSGGWGRTSAVAHGGAYSVSDSPFGPYLDETDSTLETATPINLAGRSDCSLVWYARYQMEQGFDYFAMEMRRDSGPWQEVGERISGNSGGSFLSFFEGIEQFQGSADVRLRLHFRSDATITDEGIEVDDLYIHCDA
jgi:hypothetical protein